MNSAIPNCMDITAIQTFLAAVATGSFAGAAKRVNASPSSVTERIKQLEFRLKVTLFIRDKRGCKLTPEGQRFMVSARQIVRAWEVAQHEIALPERYTRSLAFGGQYFLWDGALMNWLADTRKSQKDISLRITAGAWARLNRDLGEETLDMIVVHDPVFRRDVSAEPLFDDWLIMVGACDPALWRDHYVRIDWGRSMGVEIASRLNIAPQAGLILDLGLRSISWLIREKMAGYMPANVAAPYLAAGQLVHITDAPSFEFPAYICWRRNMDARLANDIVSSLHTHYAATPPAL